jgi:hypothetical protein
VFDGNRGHLSEDSSGRSSEEEHAGETMKRRRRNGDDKEFEATAEQVKQKVQELKKMWQCANGEHPTLCLQDLATGKCRTMGIATATQWARQIVSINSTNHVCIIHSESIDRYLGKLLYSLAPKSWSSTLFSQMRSLTKL